MLNRRAKWQMGMRLLKWKLSHWQCGEAKEVEYMQNGGKTETLDLTYMMVKS